MREMNPTDNAIEEARRAGIDLDLLDTNLSLSVAERWRQHDAALELALKLQRAAKNRDGEFQPTAPTSH
jgi:hypothetical protein